MKATVVGIYSGTQYTDGQRRIRVKIQDGTASLLNEFTVPEPVLGLGPVAVDDEFAMLVSRGIAVGGETFVDKKIS